MSRSADCGLDQSLYPSQFHFNEVATDLATAFLVITIVLYVWNVVWWLTQDMTHDPDAKHEWPKLSVNTLSALLASVVGLVLIFATWPQPLEGAGLVVVVLAQVSVLGWQDHDPEDLRKTLIEKVPDVIAVAVAAYALLDGRTRYQELSGNEFMTDHDPRIQMIVAFVLIGAGSLVGTVQELLFNIARKLPDNQRMARQRLAVKICSSLFLLLQIATSVPAIRYTATTMAGGCSLFNATKICAMVALCIGDLYSLAITFKSYKA